MVFCVHLAGLSYSYCSLELSFKMWEVNRIKIILTNVMNVDVIILAEVESFDLNEKINQNLKCIKNSLPPSECYCKT